MATFDDIEIRRPALAESYLALLAAQPGRPLALFAPRRVGKTYFLDHDLAPAAQTVGILPVYADLWLHKSAPLEALNHALEESLDDLSVPGSRAGRLAKTPVRKLGGLGVSVELGEVPDRRSLPEAPGLRLDALATRIVKQGGKVLLMLDEVQTLADAADGETLIATLRAVLHKRRADIAAVFTGSSREGLARLMSAAGAPMYQFAQMLDFPVLGEEFLVMLAKHFAKVHPGKSLELAALQEAFQRIGYKPALMRDIVKGMSAEGLTDVGQGVAHFLASDSQRAIWAALLAPLDPFERGVLLAIAQGRPPLGRETLAALPVHGGKPTVSRVRTAIDRLRRAGLVSKSAAGLLVDDPLFAEFLLGSGKT
ncbi:MAG: hypothetical protein AB1899_15605 [Pseudomonadota bacterium]